MNKLFSNYKQESIGNYHNEPVMLFLQGGKPLESVGAHGKDAYSTKFFLIEKIDETSRCATLRLLKPCNKCCHPALSLTDDCLTLSLDCICGVQYFSHIPIRDCDHEPVCLKDSICGPFAISPGFDETVLWTSNLKSKLDLSLTIWIEEGNHKGLELKIYKSNLKKYETFPISEKEQHFYFKDCKRLSLIKPMSSEQIKGMFELEWTGEIDRDLALNSWH